MAAQPLGGYCTPWRQKNRPDGFEALVGAVLRDSPRFPSAACRGVRPDLFDASTHADTVAALRLCVSCPVLNQCNRWAKSQDEQLRRRNGWAGGVEGVLGGTLWGKARRWADT